MGDSDFPVMAGSRLGFDGLDLKDLMGIKSGLRGGGMGELMRVRRDKLMPPTMMGGGLDPMAPEGTGWLYDGTQPPETFGL